MRYLVIATDYDGTLAHDGVVSDVTLAALERFRAAGGRAILVTGRELSDLVRVCPQLTLFERVVAENGGLLYDPRSGRERVLGPARDRRLVDAMREAGVSPLSVGRTIVATVEPYERVALEAIRTLGLEAQVIFNKGAVMVLPSGVNKATGLRAALDELDFSPHNVVGIGDAENDHALFDACELSVAVANAVPALKVHADLVTVGARGDGVAELIDHLLERPDDRHLAPVRHRLSIGLGDGQRVAIDPFGHQIWIREPDREGRTTLTSDLLEQLTTRRYQYCLVDPTGAYGGLGLAMHIGSGGRVPPLDEVMSALQRPEQSVIISLAGMATADQPAYVMSLLPRVRRLGIVLGRPHWLVIEAGREMLRPDWWHEAHVPIRAWPSVALVVGGRRD